jgi:hypothetical protein
MDATQRRLDHYYRFRREQEAMSNPAPPYQAPRTDYSTPGAVRGAMPGQFPGVPLLPPEVWVGREGTELQRPGAEPDAENTLQQRRLEHMYRRQAYRNGDNQHDENLHDDQSLGR